MSKFHLPSGTVIHVLVGDITITKSDAVVNVGNPKLNNRNGLNRSILNQAGKGIVAELDKRIDSLQKKELKFGDVLVTNGGMLGSKMIIHTVGVQFKTRSLSDKSAVQKIMQACLKKAHQKKMDSLAFPAIGTGLSKVDHPECISAYVNALKNWKEVFPKKILFVIFSQGLFNKIKTAFSQNFPSATGTRPSQKRASTGNKPSVSKSITTKKPANDISPKAEQTTTQASPVPSQASPVSTPDLYATDPGDSCTICLDDFTDKKTLAKCGHSFCSSCIDQSFSVVGPYCPICQMVYGKVFGQQPPGTMVVQKENSSLPGYPNCKMYILNYSIPSGKQKVGHPNPGQWFEGVLRTAYLPSNKNGETVLKMLQAAFEQKLIFTIGDSRTTNKSNVVTWNDIHHKTNMTGGANNYGYPDMNYLSRVSVELAAKGITPADVSGRRIKNQISN